MKHQLIGRYCEHDGWKSVSLLAAGIITGAVLAGPAAQAAEKYFQAVPSRQNFQLNGKPIAMEAYAVNGSNYVKLRDVGKMTGFNVSYDAASNTVRIDTASGYVDDAKESAQPLAVSPVALPSDGSQYVPKAGDIIRCSDGTDYTITDISRWNSNAFASGPLGSLPTAACDWTSFPEVPLPAPEARHIQSGADNYLFVRNLYESRRMQYTVQNLAGNHPNTGENGKLRYGAKGTPYVQIQLTIDDGMQAHSFWPWRASELENQFNSCPPGLYAMETWDVYRNGVFQYTEYQIARF